MSKSRRSSRPKTRWSLVFLLLGSFTLSYAIFKYFTRPTQPQSVGIFAITPSSLEYGDTTITGTLRKDSPIGQAGQYILVLPDARPILLDIDGLDNLLGSTVAVTGYLLPADGVQPMTMTVNSIETTSK